MKKELLIFMAGAILVGCAAPQKPRAVQKAAAVPHSSKKQTIEKAKPAEPIYISVLALPLPERSDPLPIDPERTYTFRTIPSGQPLRLFVNEENESILFFFSKKAQFFDQKEMVRSIRFGSTNHSTVCVKIISYPPSKKPDLSVVKE